MNQKININSFQLAVWSQQKPGENENKIGIIGQGFFAKLIEHNDQARYSIVVGFQNSQPWIK